MLLYEIYDDPKDEWVEPDTVDSTEANLSTQRIIQRRRQNPNHRYLGSGSFAYVGTDDRDNFGDVERISDHGESNARFLEVLWKSSTMRHNPYFPRVRAVNKEKETTIIITERLIPFNTPSIAHDQLIDVVFNTCFTLDVHQRPYPFKIYQLLDEMAVAADDDDYSRIKDPVLIQALKFISKVSKRFDSDIDLHSDNVMWRMTYPRPQLVITDPIAF